jgi:hypothetical protein
MRDLGVHATIILKWKLKQHQLMSDDRSLSEGLNLAVKLEMAKSAAGIPARGLPRDCGRQWLTAAGMNDK